MANISTSNKNAIYKHSASITTLFKGDKDPITLGFLRIKSITVNYNYDAYNMPLIYATVAMTYEQVQKFRAYQNDGTVLFNLKKYIENGDMPGLEVDVIKAECVYFMPSDIGKDKEQAFDPDRTEDYGYVFTMGFIKADHINKAEAHRNGIINGGSMSAALYWLLNDHTLLMEPLLNNAKLKQVFIPPTDSTAGVIKYLNSLSTFYDTPYRFFMDFDTTYLISSSGRGIKKKGEDINMITMHISTTYNEANMEGMTEDRENKRYSMEISGTYATLYKANLADKMVSEISSVSTTGGTQSTTVVEKDSKSVIKKKDTSIRVSNENTGLIETVKTDVLNNETTLTIIKNKIDGSIFTINKVYYINADDVYSKEEASGYYLLASKVETYLPEGQGFAMSCMVKMKRLSSQINTKEGIKLA